MVLKKFRARFTRGVKKVKEEVKKIIPKKKGKTIPATTFTPAPTQTQAPQSTVPSGPKTRAGGFVSGKGIPQTQAPTQSFPKKIDLVAQHKRAGFSSAEIRALQRRAELKVEAERRGRGFTRVEAERFLGGGAGINALRSAVRGGGKISRFVADIRKKLKEKVFLPKKVKEDLPKRLRRRKPFVETKIGKVVDLISLGAVTKKGFRKQQEEINKDIQSFNKEFGNEELSEQSFNQAIERKKQIERKQRELEKSQETFETTTKGKVKKFLEEKKEKISEKLQTSRDKRILRIFERNDIEPTSQNIANANLILDKKDREFNQEFGLLLFASGFVPSATVGVTGKVAIKTPKVSKTQSLRKTKEQIRKFKKVQQKLADFEKNLKKPKTISLQKKKFSLDPSPEQLKRILDTRKRLNKFQKKLGTQKKRIEFQKIQKKKIIKRREIFRKTTKQLEKEKQLQKQKQLRKRKIIKRRKIFKKTQEDLGIQQQIRKFQKEKAKKIIERRKRFRKFQEKTEKKLKVLENKKTKRILARRKKLIKFKKLSSSSQKTRQVLLKSPQGFKVRITESIKRMSPQQRSKLNKVLKNLRKKVDNKRFNVNKELLKQSKKVKLTKIQKLSLKRGRENLQKIKKTRKEIGNKIEQTSNEQVKVNKKIKTLERNKAPKGQIKAQKLKQRKLKKQKVKQKITQKSIQKKINKLRNNSLSSILALNLFNQVGKSKLTQKERLKQLQKEKSLTDQVQRLRQLQKQKQKQKLRKLQKQKQKQKLRKKIRTRKRIRLKIPKGRKKGLKKKKAKKGGYNVFAKPLRKKKGKKKIRLIQINVAPIKKNRAKDLRNYLVDQSLSRQGKIKSVNVKPKKPHLKVPRGYGKRTKRKFRTYKIRKGKRVALSKGRVIERGEKGRNFLLDTRSEKKGITLRKRIAQLRKESKVKPTKRKVSQKTLNILKKGREKRLEKLRKKKGGGR